MVDKKQVQEYLKKLQQADKLKGEIEAIEADFKQHVADTGEAVICNLLKVAVSKNPPKLVTTTEGGKVTDTMRQDLAEALKGTEFVKTAISIELKKLLDVKATNKRVQKALKKGGLDVAQSEKIGFERIVTPLKKGA